jgi:hypothetical protein
VLAEPERDDEYRSEAGREDPRVAGSGGIELTLGIVDEHGLAAGEAVRHGVLVRRRHSRVGTLSVRVRDGDHLQRTAVGLHDANRHRVEGDDGMQRVAEALEKVADLEASAEDRHQRCHRLEPGPTSSLSEKEHDTLNERPDCIRDVATRRRVLVAVHSWPEGRHAEPSDDTAAGVHWHRDPRPDISGH